MHNTDVCLFGTKEQNRTEAGSPLFPKSICIFSADN